MEETFFTDTNAAWWRAIISTILLGKEIYNWYRTRSTFDVSFYNTHEPVADDKIIVYNKSNRIFSIVAVNLYSSTYKNSDNRKNHDIGRYTDFEINTVNSLQPYIMHVSDDCKFRVKKDMKLFAEISEQNQS